MYKGRRLLIGVLAIMMISSSLLAVMGFMTPPFSAAEWYCYNKEWTTNGDCWREFPCFIFAGMHPQLTIRHSQQWCCNAYTCWAAGPDNTSPGPTFCAFC